MRTSPRSYVPHVGILQGEHGLNGPPGQIGPPGPIVRPLYGVGSGFCQNITVIIMRKI